MHPLPPTTCSLGWRPGSCVRPGNCVPTGEKDDIIAYLSEVSELVSALPDIYASINQQSLWAVLTSIASCHPDTLLYTLFYSLLCAGLMYFIELVTTEHKLGIITLCIKKSAPREKWKQSVFNIPYFSFSAPLPRFTFRHSACLPCCL